MIKKVVLFSYTLLICVLLIFILFKVIISNQMQGKSVQRGPSRNVAKNNANTSGEWPPLYSDITWNAPNIGFVNAYVVDPRKNVTVSQIKPDISDITSFGQKAETFSYTIAPHVSSSESNNTISNYENWFKSHGWKEDINAGGPTGDAFGFMLNGKRFLLSIYYVKSDDSEYAVIVEHN